MENLSIVIITKNEAKNIGKCLDSVHDLSNDIIIVDSGSTDETKSICSKYKTTFIVNDFQDYSSQKNFGNNLAKNAYILSIDADECLSDILKDSILALTFNTKDNLAYEFNRLNHHCGKPVKFGGWYPDKKLRIWNKNFANWEGTIHEKIVFIEKPKTIHLNGDLQHYTYSSNLEHLNQAKRFSKLNAESDFKKGKKTNIIIAYISLIIRFLTVYFFKFGIFDGKTGFFIAKTTARATFWRKYELIQLSKTIRF